LRTETKSWQSRLKVFFTDATDASIEVDTLGEESYEMQKIPVVSVVTVGTEGDVTTGPETFSASESRLRQR
jgi:hypothetical protein